MTATHSTDREALPADRAFVCRNCAHRWYYTRGHCPNCRDADVDTYTLGDGVLVAVTMVDVTPPDIRSPNWLGVARFGDVQVVGQLTGEAAVGDRVAFAGAFRLRAGDDRPNPRLHVLTE